MADYQSAQPSGPHGGRHSDAPSSQVTACSRCRKQKLRCSRETPSCKRCQDIAAVCTYPPPPDRKLLAAQRAQNAKARSLREAAGASEQQREYAPAKSSIVSEGLSPPELGGAQPAVGLKTEYGRGSFSGESPFSTLPSGNLLPFSFPSRELAEDLIEAYFCHIYNSTLLFHRETFAAEYLAGRIADCVALSMFALGAVFLDASRGPNQEYNPMLPGSDKPGEDWARAASQQVLMNCDQPRYETIQACQTLALYWWSFNQTDRTNMHNHVAYRTCRLLGYQGLPASERGFGDFHLELKRRAFWCAWSMCCLSQNNAAFKAESWREAIGLPFPADEPSFSAKQPIVKEAFDQDGHIELIDDDQPPQRRTSYMGEMVKLLSLWWEIQRFAKRYVDSGPLESLKRMSQLQELDQQLEMIRDNLGPDFEYTDQSSFATREAIHSYQLFSVYALYHLCVCTLHSSIVPVFSNIPPDPRISKKLTRMSAEEAIKHSLKLVNMATEFLGLYPEATRCPSFSAYAMFVAASIQFKSLGAQGLLRSDAISSLYPAISILEQVKRVWHPLEGLWAALENLFRGAGLDVNRLSDTRQLLARPVVKPNIDQIASHGIMGSDTDIYTYVPDEIPKSESSRHSSLSFSRGSSPNDQSGSSARKSSAGKIKAAESLLDRRSSSTPLTMPIHTRHNTQPMNWPGAQPPLQSVDPQTNSPQHQNMLSSTPHGFMPMTQTSTNMQPTGIGYQLQAADMGYASIGTGMGNHNMDLDTSMSDLWFDQPFEAIPMQQYGIWYPDPYQIPDEQYYRPPDQ